MNTPSSCVQKAPTWFPHDAHLIPWRHSSSARNKNHGCSKPNATHRYNRHSSPNPLVVSCTATVVCAHTCVMRRSCAAWGMVVGCVAKKNAEWCWVWHHPTTSIPAATRPARSKLPDPPMCRRMMHCAVSGNGASTVQMRFQTSTRAHPNLMVWTTACLSFLGPLPNQHKTYQALPALHNPKPMLRCCLSCVFSVQTTQHGATHRRCKGWMLVSMLVLSSSYSNQSKGIVCCTTTEWLREPSKIAGGAF